MQLIRYSRTSLIFANAMRAPARSNRVQYEFYIGESVSDASGKTTILAYA